MANLMTVKLNKAPGASWGFRLQGGKDFATPLCIQKVNGASVAEKAGLIAGDAIVSIGNQDALCLRHKEAQDAIVRAGNNFDMVIQRGGASVWKPQVTALPEVRSLPDGVPVATKTSLAATPKEYRPIGSGHNKAALPFREQLVPAVYNSPLKLYSDDSIAETLSAQAEVLGQGVLGVNFMKNDKAYDGRTSDVLRMVQQMDQDPEPPTPGTPTNLLGSADSDKPVQSYSFKLLERALDDGEDPSIGSGLAPITRSVQAPQTKPGSEGGDGSTRVVTGCAECERPIVGVFVRVKNKNLHAECFKCSTCGSSLKNAGYYNINDKLYCDIHAKQAARAHPPAPNMEPITIQPGVTPPSGALTSSQASRMKIPSAFQQAQGPAPMPASVPTPFKPPVGGVRLIPTSPPVLSSPNPYKRVSAPAPSQPSFVPSSPPVVAAAPPKPAPAPAVFSAASPQGFGAPAGGVNVRTHIPRKGDVPQNFGLPAPAPAPVPLIFSSAPAPGPISGFGSSMGAPKMGPGAAARGVQNLGEKTAPRRGRGVMNQASASRIPMCATCHRQIRGPFVSALGKTWCPDHFICATQTCKRNIIDMGFVEEKGGLYCEVCYEKYMAPICGKCDKRVKGDCLNAIGRQFHPECFCCAYCGKVFGSGAFYLEDGLPYCETDWNDLFTTKCVGCNFPIEAGDRWVEALNNNYHSQCFKCSKCHKNLEGQSFFAKGGKPFCKAHAQRGF